LTLKVTGVRIAGTNFQLGKLILMVVFIYPFAAKAEIFEFGEGRGSYSPCTLRDMRLIA